VSHAESLLMSVRTAVPSRHPARIRADQRFQIAAAYENAAFDISLPAQTRAAFAKKADWFRLLAQVAEKREALTTSAAKQRALEPQPNPFGFIAARH
jgi:hypothetical protein